MAEKKENNEQTITAAGGSPTSAMPAQGLSKTPAITYPMTAEAIGAAGRKSIEVRIDYLKVRFDFTYDDWLPEVMEYWDRILDAFLIDRETRVDLKHGGSRYTQGIVFEQDFFVFYGGEATKSNGMPTSIIELKGQACERFGLRAIYKAMDELGRELTDAEEAEVVRKAWGAAFSVILSLPHRCTRIDIPVDDFNENIPIKELTHKCVHREFVSRIKKAFNAKGDPVAYVEATDDEAIIRNGYGWSYTLGKPDSERQLCIYDKKSEFEQIHHGFVNADSWIRFESRFRGDHASWMMEIIAQACMSDDSLAFRKCVIGALADIIEFKDERWNGENTYKSDTWKPWADFIALGVELPKFKANIPVQTIKTNALWEKKDVSRCHFRMHMAYMEQFDEIDAYMLMEGMKRADGTDLAIINNSRKARGQKPFASLEEMKAEAVKRFPGDGSFSDPVLVLFDEDITVELEAVEEPKPEDKKGGEE